MVDQVMNLRQRSVDAAMLSSGSKMPKDLQATEENIQIYHLLFYSPEAIDTSKWREMIAKQEVSSRVVAVVVDEAHCVSKWYVAWQCIFF